MRRHKRIHYKCDICESAFTHIGALTIHKRNHSKEKSYKEKPYKCCICESAFNRKEHLKRHKLVHSREKLNKSKNYEFIQNGSMRDHK